MLPSDHKEEVNLRFPFFQNVLAILFVFFLSMLVGAIVMMSTESLYKSALGSLGTAAGACLIVLGYCALRYMEHSRNTSIAMIARFVLFPIRAVESFLKTLCFRM